MDLCEKVKRVLARSLKPERIKLDGDENGVSGYVVSERFRRLESFDRQKMIDDTLREPSARLKPEEVRRVILIVGLTPEEYRVSDLRDGDQS